MARILPNITRAQALSSAVEGNAAVTNTLPEFREQIAPDGTRILTLVDTNRQIVEPVRQAPVPPPPNPIAPPNPGRTEAQLQAEIEQRAKELADKLLAEQIRAAQQASSGRVFTRFDIGSDIIENQKTIVTKGLWSSNRAALVDIFTSSLQSTSSKQYYYQVYDATYEAVTDEGQPQFAVAYGHRFGSGSGGTGTLNDTPSRAVYSQYRLMLLNPGDTTFSFETGNSDQIYVVNFNRARMRDKVDPGNWQLGLVELSGSYVPNAYHTGSNVKVKPSGKFISLIDNSGDTQEILNGNTGRIYKVISGSLTNGVYNPSNPVYYGLFYPDNGLIVLDANVLDVSMSFNSVTGSDINGDNAYKLFRSISGSISQYGSTTYDSENISAGDFQARNEESITSTHYFVRVKNAEYNFSNNPTFTTGSVGEFSQPTFINDPKVYVTTVGMYNDGQELLAVAKLSKAIQKSFSSELLIKVKLDY